MAVDVSDCFFYIMRNYVFYFKLAKKGKCFYIIKIAMSVLAGRNWWSISVMPFDFWSKQSLTQKFQFEKKEIISMQRTVPVYFRSLEQML
jgi:hypothetical protein